MEERIQQEFLLIRKYFPNCKIDENKRWILLPNFKLPEGLSWNKTIMDICIEIRPGYPGTPPYGIYVPSDLRFDGKEPQSWQLKASNHPSFSGSWGMISWSPIQWMPGSDVIRGSNLLNFILSFSDRFKEGQ